MTTPVEDLLRAQRPVVDANRPVIRERPLTVAGLISYATRHVSIVLPGYDEVFVRPLIAVLGPELPNPFFERRTP